VLGCRYTFIIVHFYSILQVSLWVTADGAFFQPTVICMLYNPHGCDIWASSHLNTPYSQLITGIQHLHLSLKSGTIPKLAKAIFDISEKLFF
jgi:hypothetical protein